MVFERQQIFCLVDELEFLLALAFVLAPVAPNQVAQFLFALILLFVVLLVAFLLQRDVDVQILS